MATFAKTFFNALSYAAFRPTYPPALYKTILAYHNGPSNTLLDLGCGHGLISRSLSPHFTSILATDPSASMITQAKSSSTQYPNIQFRQASAENLDFIEDGSLDMVVAGQAAHWFDYSKVWPELGRKLREGGTLAFWGYKDNIFVDYPAATRIFDEYCYGEHTMGPFWEQPGRRILRDLYRDIVPPGDEWEGVQRVEYEPGLEGKGKGKGRGEVLMSRRLKLGEVEGMGGRERDIADVMFEKMLEVEPEWKARGEAWRDFEVENEWGSVILMARNNQLGERTVFVAWPS
ncbi:Trans-aconitate 3-methyltransferase [Lachnellula arida]|uniref:Trans-aconitate 3-methyltransferase n=1 Tax=Lachnellula arida TaxID=1316785 RepID=A0A8T9B0X6_9HELO|nr:Trans-aconitate 3-methyltransferase [Lachnellula arida]